MRNSLDDVISHIGASGLGVVTDDEPHLFSVAGSGKLKFIGACEQQQYERLGKRGGLRVYRERNEMLPRAGLAER